MSKAGNTVSKAGNTISKASNIVSKAGNIVKNTGNYLKKHAVEIVLIVLILAICLLHAIKASYNVNFNPINGTFQNYNVIRRLLEGQIPYKEFTAYLGMGHLYLGGIFTFIFGNSFAASLVAFTFLTILTLCLFSILIGRIVLNGNRKIAYSFTLLLLITLIISPSIFTNFLGITQEFVDALNGSLSPGNSARYIRGMMPALFVIFLGLGYKACIFLYKKKPALESKKYIMAVIGYSIVSGFAFLWSNDYGIGSWICSILLLMVITFSRTRKISKVLIVFAAQIVISMLSIFVFVEIFTLGNWGSWLEFTFGAGNYQSWYFQYASFYIYEVDFSYLILFQAILTLYYLWQVFRLRGTFYAIKRYGILAFFNMVAFAAVNEYRLLSGGSSTEVALAILYLCIVYELLGIVITLTKQHARISKLFVIASILCGVTMVTSMAKNEIISFRVDARGEYFEGLGGYLSSLNVDINKAVNFIGEEKIFSTYASALETVTDQFQPSGTDYVIHVLGDDARADYLADFNEADFKYATTFKETFNGWEYWIRNANWFFYRELYANYHPVFSNSYQLFWEKDSEADGNTLSTGINVEYIQIDKENTKIVVTADTSVSGIADVWVSYSTEKDGSIKSKLAFNSRVMVIATTAVSISGDGHEYYWIPQTGETYIPVTVVNGYGEVTLNSQPNTTTLLTVNDAICLNIYRDNFSYLDIASVAYVENETCKLNVLNSNLNAIITTGIKSIEVEGNTIDVLQVDIVGENIVLSLNIGDKRLNTLLEQCNIVKVVK